MSEQGSLPLVVPDPPVERVDAELVEARDNPEFTGARYRAQHPDRAEAIVRLFREGASIAACARAFVLSRNTVAALLRDADASLPLEQVKAKAAAEYRQLAALCRDRMRERVLDGCATIPFRDLAVSAGIMEDKAALVSGDIPVLFVASSDPLTVEAFERRVAAVREARRIGSGVETLGQKEAAAVGQAGGAAGELGPGGGDLVPAGEVAATAAAVEIPGPEASGKGGAE